MLNYKTIFLSCICCLLLACKGPHFAFDPQKHVTSDLWKNETFLSELEGGNIKVAKINKVYVYRADFEEKMIEQNGVSNYLMVNTESPKFKDEVLAINGYKHKLFLLVFSILPEEKPSIAIYFSTSYNANGNCIGIDPIYVGEIMDNKKESDVFQTIRTLNIKQVDKHFELSKAGKKSVADFRFIADESLLPSEDTNCCSKFKFTQIIQGRDNMISGDSRKLIFHPGQIFKDDHALDFKLVNIITP